MPPVLAVLMTLLPAAGPQDPPPPKPLLLEYSFRKGDVWKTRVTVTNTQKMRMNGNNLGFALKQAATLRTEILEADGTGTARLQITLVHLKLEFEQGENRSTFDSSDREEFEEARSNPILAILAGMLDQPLTFRASRSGEVSDLNTGQSLNESSGQTADGQIHQLIHGSLPGLPEGPVLTGERWKQSRTYPSGAGPVKDESDCALEGTEEVNGTPCARIGAKRNLTFSGDPKGAVKMTVQEQDGASTVFFSTQMGAAIRSRTHMKLKGILEAHGMDLSIDQDVATETERLPDEPRAERTPPEPVKPPSPK